MADNKKSTYRGFTPAQAEAHKRYMKDFVEIKVRMIANKRSIVQNHAAKMGEVEFKISFLVSDFVV